MKGLSEMQADLKALVTAARAGTADRRTFITRATALGLSPLLASQLAHSVYAQDATPAASPVASPVASPAATGLALTSATRDDYFAQLLEAYPMEEAANPGGQVIYVYTSDIRVLNPTLVTDTYSSLITSAVFSGLVTTSAIDGTIVPDLADYWERSDDGLVYTFHLNQNATFHDGTPVTSADVVFSFDSIMAEDSLSVRRSDLVQVVAGYRAIDDYTFELTALDTYAVFLEKSAGNVGILPKHIWESIPFADWGASPGSTGQDPAQDIGSGPFKFVEWVPEDHVTIQRNENYWDTPRLPVIDEFIYRVVPEPTAATQTLVTGESDIYSIPAAQADDLKASNPELQIIDYDSTSFTYFIPHQDPTKVRFFTDRRVR